MFLTLPMFYPYYYLLEYMALNKKGSELFMKDFRKLWRYNEVQCRITDTEIQKAIKQNCLSWLSANQPVVFAIQPVVFISRVKNNLKA